MAKKTKAVPKWLVVPVEIGNYGPGKNKMRLGIVLSDKLTDDQVRDTFLGAHLKVRIEAEKNAEKDVAGQEKLIKGGDVVKFGGDCDCHDVTMKVDGGYKLSLQFAESIAPPERLHEIRFRKGKMTVQRMGEAVTDSAGENDSIETA